MATASPAVTSEHDDRLLHLAAIVFAIAVLVHNSDHLRRGGDSVPTDVFVLGTLGMILEVAVVALVLMQPPPRPAGSGDSRSLPHRRLSTRSPLACTVMAQRQPHHR
jgi:hypothetical protein